MYIYIYIHIYIYMVHRLTEGIEPTPAHAQEGAIHLHLGDNSQPPDFRGMWKRSAKKYGL